MRANLSDAVQMKWSAAGLLLAIISAVLIGALVSFRRPVHPVGWLISGFGMSILLAGVTESYSSIAFLGAINDLPGSAAAAAYSNADFVPWLTLMTLVLALTPSGKLEARWGKPYLAACVGAGVVFFLTLLVKVGPLQFPLEHVDNPAGIDGLGSTLGALRLVAATVVNLGLLTSAVLLLRRFRRSTGEERNQLKWVAVSGVGIVFVAILPAFAGTQLSASATSAVVSIVVGAGFVLILLGIAASVLQYRLYDVDRVLSSGTAYLLITVVLASVFLVATLGLSLVTNSRDSTSLRVGVSTLAAAIVAGLVRGRIQEAVDRRFRRRRYEATSVMRAFLAAAPTGHDDADGHCARRRAM